MQLSLNMALASSKLNIIVVLVFCVSYAQAACTCEKTPPTGNCVCQSDNSNPTQCKVCLCDHITTYVKGPPVCYCRPGYAVSSRDHKKCVDIDECNSPEGNPCQQICTNTVGSFSCSCSPGYTVSSTNPNACDDIDECNSPEGNPCQQICTNTVGSFLCSCSPGYTVSSTNPNACDDIDECNSPEGNPCQQICTNTVGSFSCSCSPSYTVSSTNPNECVCYNVLSSNTLSGTIISPDYPQNYPNDLTCTWNLQANPLMIITIRFLDFDLETVDSCIFDSVKVYNGTSETDPLLAVYCGENIPDPVSSTNGLYLVFKTDDSVTRRGFEIAYAYESILASN